MSCKTNQLCDVNFHETLKSIEEYYLWCPQDNSSMMNSLRRLLRPFCDVEIKDIYEDKRREYEKRCCELSQN